jgi:hypothetical protein
LPVEPGVRAASRLGSKLECRGFALQIVVLHPGNIVEEKWKHVGLLLQQPSPDGSTVKSLKRGSPRAGAKFKDLTSVRPARERISVEPSSIPGSDATTCRANPVII